MDPLLGELTDDEDFLHVINHVVHPRAQQQYRTRPNHFTKWNDREFKTRFRLEKPVVEFIIAEISENIKSRTNKNHALTPSDMVCLTLRFLATGSYLTVAGDFGGVDKSTMSRVIYKVVRAIAGLHRNFITMPQNEDEINFVKEQFYDISRFPRCIGALDCTHIRIQSPGGPLAETYRNRKSFFSFNVQVICSADLKIQNIVCRWPGASHDSNIFRNSRIRHRIENGEFNDSVLVGDSGYGITSYLITPLLNPQTPAEILFNEAQIRTRNPVERVFGIWKRRFPILALGIRLAVEKVEAIVVATAILHNIACSLGDLNPPEVNREIEAAIELTNNINNNVQDLEAVGVNNRVRYALITQYFQRLL